MQWCTRSLAIEITQTRKVNGLNHQENPLAKEANRESISITQSKYLRARLGEGPELICDIRNPWKVHRADAVVLYDSSASRACYCCKVGERQQILMTISHAAA